MFRDPQEEHPEIQQLHLSHCVTGWPSGPHQQARATSASEFWLVGGKGCGFGVKDMGFTSTITGRSFPAFFPFCAFLSFDLVHFDLTCAVT